MRLVDSKRQLLYTSRICLMPSLAFQVHTASLLWSSWRSGWTVLTFKMLNGHARLGHTVFMRLSCLFGFVCVIQSFQTVRLCWSFNALAEKEFRVSVCIWIADRIVCFSLGIPDVKPWLLWALSCGCQIKVLAELRLLWNRWTLSGPASLPTMRYVASKNPLRFLDPVSLRFTLTCSFSQHHCNCMMQNNSQCRHIYWNHGLIFWAYYAGVHQVLLLQEDGQKHGRLEPWSARFGVADSAPRVNDRHWQWPGYSAICNDWHRLALWPFETHRLQSK